MKKWLKIILFVLGVALALAALVGVFFFVLVSQSSAW